jgi:6-phosphogluconolactonase/glucosamine-6-phosphate isomerase/deaminase
MATFETHEFTYSPSHHIPFRDKAILEKMRDITRDDFINYSSPGMTVKVIKESDVTFMFMADVFFRIKDAMEAGRKLVMILPQPWSVYKEVAYMLNRCRIDCRNLYTFNMDEYADENGNIAPESWSHSFKYALKKYFYNELDPSLRPPEKQMIGITNENFKDYGKMITDLGGADVCYSGPGWTGHLAFIDPDAPEVPKDLEEFKKLGPTMVTLSPFSLAQLSLHGCFGASGDTAAVPPKGVSIGPAQLIESKYNIGLYCIGVHSTATSWQRLVTRLALFGPVTPLVPDSLMQLQRGEAWVSESIAKKIEIDWDKGY